MKSTFEQEEVFMGLALEQAKKAMACDEVPIGAVLVQDGLVIATAFNLREQKHNAIAHAEILVIEEACRKLQKWRLSSCELYVTLEPCLMCAGALVQARIKTVYFGALDPKGGALGSLYRVHEDVRLNHRFAVRGGILGKECGALLQQFFQKKRTRT